DDDVGLLVGGVGRSEYTEERGASRQHRHDVAEECWLHDESSLSIRKRRSTPRRRTLRFPDPRLPRGVQRSESPRPDGEEVLRRASEPMLPNACRDERARGESNTRPAGSKSKRRACEPIPAHTCKGKSADITERGHHPTPSHGTNRTLLGRWSRGFFLPFVDGHHLALGGQVVHVGFELLHGVPYVLVGVDVVA